MKIYHCECCGQEISKYYAIKNDHRCNDCVDDIEDISIDSMMDDYKVDYDSGKLC